MGGTVGLGRIKVGTTQFLVEINGQSITGDCIDVWTAPPYTPQQDFAIFIDNVVGR